MHVLKRIVTHISVMSLVDAILMVSFLVIFGILMLNVQHLEDALQATHEVAKHSQQEDQAVIKQLQLQLNEQQQQHQRQLIEQQLVIDELQNQMRQLVNIRIKNRELVMNVSAYTTAADESDGQPGITSTMTKPVVGKTCAVSRELIHRLQHKRIFIDGVGIRTINDTMNERFNNSIDLLVASKSKARDFGRKELRVVVLD